MKLAIILLIALGLRLISLNQSFWLDEATSVTIAHNLSFRRIIYYFSPGDFHPPLYYVMLKAWVSIFGISEVSVRLLSVSFALATIVVVYYIGTELANKRAGYMAALLLATAPLHIYYSQEARMYVPLTFFVALAVLIFIKRQWRLFALSLIAIAGTDYMGILVFPVFWIAALLQRKKFPWKAFLMAHIPLALVSLWWWRIFSQQLQGGLSIKDSAWGAILGGASLIDLGLIPVKFLIGRISFISKYIYISAVIAIGTFVSFAFYQSFKLAKKLTFVWLWLVVPIVVGVLISLKIPVLSYFRVIYCLPALYLLIVFGTGRNKIGNIVFTLILIFNTVFSGYYLFHSNFHRENWRELAEFITQNSSASFMTLFVADSQMEAYRFYAPYHTIRGGEQAVTTSYHTIWLMRYVQDLFDPEDRVRKKVEDLGYKKVSEYNFNGIVVYKYENLY